MIHVATCKARGMFPGQVIGLRRITGHHRWHVVVTYKRPLETPEAEGDVESVVEKFDAEAPCDIRDMHAGVLHELGLDIPDGTPVLDYSFDYYIHGARKRRT